MTSVPSYSYGIIFTLNNYYHFSLLLFITKYYHKMYTFGEYFCSEMSFLAKIVLLYLGWQATFYQKKSFYLKCPKRCL